MFRHIIGDIPQEERVLIAGFHNGRSGAGSGDNQRFQLAEKQIDRGELAHELCELLHEYGFLCGGYFTEDISDMIDEQ